MSKLAAVVAAENTSKDILWQMCNSFLSSTYNLQEASPGSNYKSSDLLLVSGYGNDATALVDAYLVPDSGGFAAMTGTLIPHEILCPLLATSPPGFAQAGLLYSLHGKAGRQGSTTVSKYLC